MLALHSLPRKAKAYGHQTGKLQVRWIRFVEQEAEVASEFREDPCIDMRRRPRVLPSSENFQKLSQQNMEKALKILGNWQEGWRTISTEMTDFTKRSFEDGAATVEKLLSAKVIGSGSSNPK
jgi:hypothetical protein